MVRKVVRPATISVFTVVLFSPNLNMRVSPPRTGQVCGQKPVQNQSREALFAGRKPAPGQFPARPEDVDRMRMSQYFLPTMKETPSEAQIVSHRLMLRAGLVRQTSAGIYAWLPLGLRVLRNIERIVREEQDRAGGQEILMPTIQPAELWRESGRYEDYGKEMLRIRDRHDRDMLYWPTNEEMVTDLFRQSIKSYRELPQILYYIQWKFRDEVRPRFGVMRGREFLMKDAYSFDIDHDGAVVSYRKMMLAYMR